MKKVVNIGDSILFRSPTNAILDAKIIDIQWYLDGHRIYAQASNNNIYEITEKEVNKVELTIIEKSPKKGKKTLGTFVEY